MSSNSKNNKHYFNRLLAIALSVVCGLTPVISTPAFASSVTASDEGNIVYEEPSKETEIVYEEEVNPEVENLADEDFASRRLIVINGNVDDHLLASYGDVHLMAYDTVEDAKNAYLSYQEQGAVVEPDNTVEAANLLDGILGESDSLEDMTEEENPMKEAAEAEESVEVEKAKGIIALIDTGVSGNKNIVGKVSVIGDDLSGGSHGNDMAKAIRSMNEDANILSIRAMNDNGEGSVSSIVAAMEYAMSQNVKVINLSMSTKTNELNAVIAYEIKKATEAGIIVVGAAGNDGEDAKNYIPGAVEEAYIIGACDENGKILETSNFGNTVDYLVKADSTSEAAAKFSAYVAKNGVENINSSEIFANVSVEDRKDTILSIGEGGLVDVYDGKIFLGSYLSTDAANVSYASDPEDLTFKLSALEGYAIHSYKFSGSDEEETVVDKGTYQLEVKHPYQKNLMLEVTFEKDESHVVKTYDVEDTVLTSTLEVKTGSEFDVYAGLESYTDDGITLENIYSNVDTSKEGLYQTLYHAKTPYNTEILVHRAVRVTNTPKEDSCEGKHQWSVVSNVGGQNFNIDSEKMEYEAGEKVMVALTGIHNTSLRDIHFYKMNANKDSEGYVTEEIVAKRVDAPKESLKDIQELLCYTEETQYYEFEMPDTDVLISVMGVNDTVKAAQAGQQMQGFTIYETNNRLRYDSDYTSGTTGITKERYATWTYYDASGNFVPHDKMVEQQGYRAVYCLEPPKGTPIGGGNSLNLDADTTGTYSVHQLPETSLVNRALAYLFGNRWWGEDYTGTDGKTYNLKKLLDSPKAKNTYKNPTSSLNLTNKAGEAQYYAQCHFLLAALYWCDTHNTTTVKAGDEWNKTSGSNTVFNAAGVKWINNTFIPAVQKAYKPTTELSVLDDDDKQYDVSNGTLVQQTNNTKVTMPARNDDADHKVNGKTVKKYTIQDDGTIVSPTLIYKSVKENPTVIQLKYTDANEKWVEDSALPKGVSIRLWVKKNGKWVDGGVPPKGTVGIPVGSRIKKIQGYQLNSGDRFRVYFNPSVYKINESKPFKLLFRTAKQVDTQSYLVEPKNDGNQTLGFIYATGPQIFEVGFQLKAPNIRIQLAKRTPVKGSDGKWTNAWNSNMSGATFALYKGTATSGTPVATLTINGAGYHGFLEYGKTTVFHGTAGTKYTIVETKAPNGYQKHPNVTFTLGNVGDADIVNLPDEDGNDTWNYAHREVIYETRKLNLRIRKKSSMDETTSYPSAYSLKDAQYGVYSDEECTDKLTTLTTDDKGLTGEFSLPITKGMIRDNWDSWKPTYYVKELVAPKGFKLDSTVHTVTFNMTDYFGEDVFEYSVVDEPETIDFSLLKVDKGTQHPLEGVIFKVNLYKTTDAKKLTDENRTKTWYLKSDKDGKVLLDKSHVADGYKSDSFITSSGKAVIPKGGMISVQEVVALEGYTLDETVHTWSTNATIKKTLTNSQSSNPTLQIHKESDMADFLEFGTAYSLEGAKFGVYTDENCDDSDKIATLVTDADGNSNVFDVPVPKDETELTLYVKELEAPKGHQVSNKLESVTYTFPADNKANKSVTFTDVADVAEVPDALVQKFDGTSGEQQVLAGVIFAVRIFDTQDENAIKDMQPVRTWYLKSNGDGKIDLNDKRCQITDNSSYVSDEFYKKDGKTVLPRNVIVQLEELVPLEDYILPEDPTWILPMDGAVINAKKIYNYKNADASLHVEKKSNYNDFVTEFSNYSVEGAEFTLYDDEALTNEIGTLTTNEAGRTETFSLKELLPESIQKGGSGTYSVYVKETTAPAGHTLNSEVKKVDFTFPDDNGKNTDVAVEFTNDAEVNTPNAFIKKLDSETEQPLANAVFKFELYDTDDESAMTDVKKTWYLVSDENGEVKLDDAHLAAEYKSDSFYMMNGKAVLPKDRVLKVTEVKAPEGYMIDETESFNLSTNVTNARTVLNTLDEDSKPSSIRIKKYGSDGKTTLEGVTFELRFDEVVNDTLHTKKTFDYDPLIFDEGDSVTATTDKNGEIVFENLRPGKYTLTETSTVSGQTLLAKPITVTLPSKYTKEELAQYGDKVNLDKGEYDEKTQMYYFYDMTYEITNNAVFSMPFTGASGDFKLGYLGILAIALLGAGLLVMEAKRKKA